MLAQGNDSITVAALPLFVRTCRSGPKWDAMKNWGAAAYRLAERGQIALVIAVDADTIYVGAKDASAKHECPVG